jgi:hypothetical protein
MWWNDIKEIKDSVVQLSARFILLQDRLKELRKDVLENDPYNSFSDRLDEIKDIVASDENRAKHVLLAEKTLDKFEDYMKNVDKFNSMVNEYKGCVSMARSAVAERKELNSEFDDMRNMAKICQEIYTQYFKIDAMYKFLIKENEKPKKKSSRKKKVTPAS